MASKNKSKKSKADEKIVVQKFDEINLNGEIIKTEPANYLLVKDGIVQNIIIAHPGFIEFIKEHWDHIEKVDPDKIVAKGWIYKDGEYSDPNPPPEKIHDFKNPEDANNIGEP